MRTRESDVATVVLGILRAHEAGAVQGMRCRDVGVGVVVRAMHLLISCLPTRAFQRMHLYKLMLTIPTTGVHAMMMALAATRMGLRCRHGGVCLDGAG